jgi:hypothetical protein
MRNPYAQVALTYVRRWRSIYDYLMFVAVLFMVVSAYYASASKMRPPPVHFFMFAYFAGNLFVALSFHIRQQFADSRSRLMPGFCRVHATVAAVVILIFSVALPVVVSWILGLHSVGLVAISLTLFSGFLWLALFAWVWLTVVIGVFLAVGWFAMFTEPVCAALVQLAQGGCEPLAVGLLIFGVATTALGIRRLLLLNEDMPRYHGWTAVSAERCDAAAQRSAGKSLSRLGLRERLEERRVARLIEHVQRAPASWWAGVRRWQVMMPAGIPIWLVSVLGMLVTLLFCTWLIKSEPGIPRTLACLLSVVLPMASLTGHLTQRKGAIGRELLLPVDRGLYLRQLGAAAAFSQLRCWSAIGVATLVWWLAVVRGSVSANTIASILALSALSQFWLFAAVAWIMPDRHMVVAPVVGALLAGGLLAPIVTNGFTAAPRLDEWQNLIWTAAGLLTLFSMFLIWAAYRRWLVADFD